MVSESFQNDVTGCCISKKMPFYFNRTPVIGEKMESWAISKRRNFEHLRETFWGWSGLVRRYLCNRYWSGLV